MGVCRAEAGTCGCRWEEVGSGMSKPEHRVINFVCDWSFWNWLQNRFLGCRACRREGRDDGEASDRAGDEFATSYGPSRPMRGSDGRGSDVFDDR